MSVIPAEPQGCGAGPDPVLWPSGSRTGPHCAPHSPGPACSVPESAPLSSCSALSRPECRRQGSLGFTPSQQLARAPRWLCLPRPQTPAARLGLPLRSEFTWDPTPGRGRKVLLGRLPVPGTCLGSEGPDTSLKPHPGAKQYLALRPQVLMAASRGGGSPLWNSACGKLCRWHNQTEPCHLRPEGATPHPPRSPGPRPSLVPCWVPPPHCSPWFLFTC